MTVAEGPQPGSRLPPAALEAYARALLNEATQRAWNFKLKVPAPFQYRQDYTRALVTSAREALSHGDQPAAVHQDPGLSYAWFRAAGEIDGHSVRIYTYISDAARTPEDTPDGEDTR